MKQDSKYLQVFACVAADQPYLVVCEADWYLPGYAEMCSPGPYGSENIARLIGDAIHEKNLPISRTNRRSAEEAKIVATSNPKRQKLHPPRSNSNSSSTGSN